MFLDIHLGDEVLDEPCLGDDDDGDNDNDDPQQLKRMLKDVCE